MRSVFAKLKLFHLVLAALLVATLWFPSAREAHSLCFRLLLHLKGDTFVHGQQPGCVVYTIPRVEFTPQCVAEIRSRSNDSLDAYALAVCTGEKATLEPPKFTSAETNNPLLIWAALRLARASDWQHDTNNPAAFKSWPVTVASARQAIRLAQMAGSTNGALWLATADLDFSEGRDADALAALQLAASNSWWSGSSGVAFTNLTALYQAAGLSELDAALEVNWGRADAAPLELQGNCSRQLTRRFTQAINSGDVAKVSGLLKTLVDLRRAEWDDRSTMIFNSISLRDYYDDLINAMALQMGRVPMPTNDAVDYRQVKELRQKTFNDFFNHLPDQRLAVAYLTQNEKIHYEKRLRSQIGDRYYPRVFYWGILADVFAGLAGATLSVMVFFLIVELLIWKLNLHELDLKASLRRPKFRLAVFLCSLGLALLMTNWSVSLGMNAKVGLRLTDEPLPLLPPDLCDFLLWLVLPLATLLTLYFIPGKFCKDWKLKPGSLTMLTLVVYLASILLMAICRHGLADLISGQYL